MAKDYYREHLKMATYTWLENDCYRAGSRRKDRRSSRAEKRSARQKERREILKVRNEP